MNQRFLSLKEAEEYTGKSRSSLRRFVEAITKVKNHPDRKFLDPSVERVLELHTANHPFSWRISQELLDRDFTKEGSDQSPATGFRNEAATEIMNVLQKTITMLENELNEKNKQIALFQERQRESNLLLQQTTEKLTMLSGPTRFNVDESVTVKHTTMGEEEENDAETVYVKSPKKPKTKRSSLWQRLTKPIF